MKLGEIFSKDLVGKFFDIEIENLAINSKDASKNSLFFAFQGDKDNGVLYINQAIERGAVAVVVDQDISIDQQNIAFIKVDDVRTTIACVAALFYPKTPKNIVAVTGTSGKSSIVSFLRQIWIYSGFQSASIGTIGVETDKFKVSTALTTPNALELRKFLHLLADENFTHIALEASSHGIEQKRLDNIPLAAAAFTNLSHDHLDYHKTMDEYFLSKMRLFTELLPEGAPLILFSDDFYSIKVKNHLHKYNIEPLTVGRLGQFIKLRKINPTYDKQHIEIEINKQIYHLDIPLLGEFQVTNALIAAALALSIGAPLKTVLEALEKLKGAEGRLQCVAMKEDKIPIFIDYAHKPEALSTILKTVRSFTTNRIILVFGCGGNRDKGKRRLMGEIAQKHADIIIITDDNPRDENPEDIRREIIQGANNATEIADRTEAIEYAIAVANQGDTVIIAGKGHETGQIIKNQIVEFSDKNTILKILQDS